MMIGTKFYKPLQNDELLVYEDKPVFETVVVFEEKTYTEQVNVVDEKGNVKVDSNGNPVVETVEFKVKDPKLDANGNVVTEQKQVFDEDGKPVTQREQVGTKPNDAPNTLAKYAQAAEWCNANGAIIEDKGEYYEVVALPEPTEEEKQERLQKQMTDAVQVALDAFAQTRGYDGIMSACSYSNSTDAQFKLEADYCIQLRDTTWRMGYAILAEVKAGTRAIPTVEELIAELPIGSAQWP